MADQPQSSRRSPAFSLLFWSTVSLVVLMLIGLATAVILWLVMPQWLHAAIIERSPSFPLVFHANQRAGTMYDSPVHPLRERFPDEVVFPFLIGRLTGSNPQDRRFAAYYINFLVEMGRESDPPTPVLTGGLRPLVVDALLAGLDLPDIEDRVAMSCALCNLHPDVPLPRMIAAWERLPDSIDRDQIAVYMSEIDNPLVCDLVLRWFAERPAPAHFYALVKQTSPPASAFLIKALRDPRSPHFDELLAALAWHSPSDPAVLAEVKPYCRDLISTDLSDRALTCLVKSPAGMPFLLDLRLDPTAANLHALIDVALDSRKEVLSDDQRRRWESVRKP